MKIFTQWFIVIFSSLFAPYVAQNLVPNPSFEDTVHCPIYQSQVYNCVSWFPLQNSSDFIYNCASVEEGVPANNLGYQFPATGNGYCGIYTRGGTYREYIRTHLISPLIPGVKYYVSFKLSKAEGNQSITMGSCNKFGARFSTNPLPGSFLPDNFSQVFTNSIITDSVGWALVSKSFIADSSYNNICLGNFFDDGNTNWIGSSTYCYYFIDDVCVSPDSTSCNFLANYLAKNEAQKFIKINPNPFNSFIDVNSSLYGEFELSIFDSFSNIINFTRFSNNIRINTENFREGVFYYSIKQNKTIISNGKIIKLIN